jgi:hypothetical protein
MLAETLMALAALAGNTVVAAATTDAWEAARRGFARLLQRLEGTHRISFVDYLASQCRRRASLLISPLGST